MTQKRSLEPTDLYRLRLLSDPQISPDGTCIAFVRKQMSEEKNEYVGNIHVVDSDGSVRQFTSGDKDSAPRWSPDGKWLAFVSGRKEKAQLHLLSTAGGESVALTDRTLGAGVPSWSPDSRYIVFTGPVSTDPEEDTEENKDKDPKKKARARVLMRSSYKLDGAGFIGNRRRHLFVVDVAARTINQLTEGDFHDDNASWSPDGRHIAFASGRGDRWDVDTANDIYVIPREGGQARRLTQDGAFSYPTFSPDGSRIAFVGSTEHRRTFGPPRLYSIDRSGEDLRDELGGWNGTVGHDVISDVALPDDGLGLRWDENGLRFIGTVRGESNVFCSQNAEIRPVTQGCHSVVDWSASAGAIACSISDPTHPAEVFRFEDCTLTQLTHENRDFLEEVYIATPERWDYSGANGEPGDARLLPPRGYESGKHPLIVYIHGGPATTYGESFFFEYQFLAAQGFGVLYPNIHGSSSYGPDYELSIHGDWGNLDYKDVLAVTDEALSRTWVDSDRLGIIGGSYGGYMTGWVMSHTDRFKAAVTERCLCNIVSFFGTMDFGYAWNRQTGLFPEDDVQRLWDMSPLKYVANIQAPTMVIHSEGDDRTPIEQGEQMFNALRRLGKDTKFIIFPEESHGLSRIGTPSRRVERMGYIAEWFRDKL